MTARLSPRALAQVRALADHYERLDRPEAIRNLAAAVETAQHAVPLFERHPPAPGPYPGLARSGTAWIKSGRYWIAYSTRRPRFVRAVFHDTANIPARL